MLPPFTHEGSMFSIEQQGNVDVPTATDAAGSFNFKPNSYGDPNPLHHYSASLNQVPFL